MSDIAELIIDFQTRIAREYGRTANVKSITVSSDLYKKLEVQIALSARYNPESYPKSITIDTSLGSIDILREKTDGSGAGHADRSGNG